jgi:hypothetical protein
MDPITLALLGSSAISAVSGIAQFIQNRGANAANQGELNQLKELAGKLQQPDFDVRDIPPAQLRVLQQYSPQIATYVPQKSPELVKAMSAGAVAGRNAQNNALDTYSRTALSGTDPLLEQAQQRAMQQAAAQSGSAIATSQQNLQRQGMGTGSGLGYATQLAQAAGSQDALANAGQANAADQYNRRILATQNAAQLGGVMRGEDVSQEQANANAMNEFNKNVASMGNTYNQYAAGQNNAAQQFNMQQNQNAYETNTNNRYTNAVANRDYSNKQKQQTYDNNLNRLNTQFALGNNQQKLNTQGAQTNNQAIQGLGDAANTGVMAYNAYNRPDKETNPTGYNPNPYTRNKKQGGY